MLKKIALAAVSALAASAMLASAAAAQVAPGSYTLTTVGSQRLTVQQSVRLNCLASLNLRVNAGGTTGSISGGSLSPGDGLCSNVTLTGFSWPVSIGTFTGGSAPITVSNVGASTILGSCSGGVLSGTINSSGVISITTSSGWTSTPSFFTCSVIGQLTM